MRIYKQNNKLIVYLPLEVTKGLNLGENDEVEFFRYNDKAFVVAKKADLANFILGREGQQRPQQQRSEQAPERRAERPTIPMQPGRVPFSKIPSISPEELHVLKKLDTLRFQQRTEAGVAKILNAQEKNVLERMLKYKIVALFKKDGVMVYSIPKSVYDTFLMRNKPQTPAEPAQNAARQHAHEAPRVVIQKTVSGPASMGNPPEVKTLEEQGYLVLQTESEAARVSLMLEESIRRGMVLGTRSFNKNREFFVVMRWFIDRQIPAVFKLLRESDMRVSEIASKLGVPEEAARAVLYILAEKGEVRERRKDLFAMA